MAKDSEPAIKVGGKLVIQKDSIFTGCTAHCIDLILEDIGKESNDGMVVEQGKRMIGFICNRVSS